MKVKVSRTSLWGDEDSPLDGTTRQVFDHIDRRTFKSPEDHDRNLGHRGLWSDKGVDHKVTASGIERTIPNGDVGWFMEIDGLDELKEIVVKHGQCVLDWDERGWWNLEIYDGYRE